MVILVLEILIFLVLALLLGTLLGYMLSRSVVRDVRTSVEQLKLDVAAGRKQLSAAETDLELHKSAISELRAAYDGLQERLSVHSDRQADLSGQMEGLVAARSALSERTATLASKLTEAQAGLGRQLEAAQQSVMNRLDGLSADRDDHAQRLFNLEGATDGLTAEQRALGQRLARVGASDLLASAAAPHGPAALATLDQRLTGVERQVEHLAEADAALASRLEAVSDLPQRFSGLDQNRQDLDVRVRALETLPVQLEATRTQFERIQSTTAAMASRLEHQDRWGQETEDRLEAIEGRLSGDGGPAPRDVSSRTAEPRATEAAPRTAAVADAAANAAPDDLTRIRGVGAALERVLNDAGIRRFEQIAAWTPSDIERYSPLLGKFHSKITRDDWVAQAKALLSEDRDGAKKPARPRANQKQKQSTADHWS